MAVVVSLPEVVSVAVTEAVVVAVAVDVAEATRATRRSGSPSPSWAVS